jgi:hypothetical protein
MAMACKSLEPRENIRPKTGNRRSKVLQSRSASRIAKVPKRTKLENRWLVGVTTLMPMLIVAEAVREIIVTIPAIFMIFFVAIKLSSRNVLPSSAIDHTKRL